MASQQEAPLDAVYFDNANDMDLVERYLADLQQQQQQQPVEVQPPAPSGKSFRIFSDNLHFKTNKAHGCRVSLQNERPRRGEDLARFEVHLLPRRPESHARRFPNQRLNIVKHANSPKMCVML